MGGVLGVVAKAPDQFSSFLSHVAATVIAAPLAAESLYDLHHFSGSAYKRLAVQTPQRMTVVRRIGIDSEGSQLFLELRHQTLSFLVEGDHFLELIVRVA